MSLFNNAIIGASGQQGYQISRSLRFRSSASAYLNRTFGTPTLNTKWTVSVWCKKSGIAVGQNILGTSGSGEGVQLRFDSGDTITVTTDTGGVSYAATSNALYRDPSAWYHIVVAVDTTQATAANRLTVYVNGAAITWSSFAVCPQNTNTAWNKSGIIGYIGSYDNTPIRPFNGYMAEIVSVDGQTLTSSSFGMYNSQTGVWGPIRYSGTYGNNGFYLNFSDNSAATAAAIGKDYSGNGNNWTPNNISVTAGNTYDSMIDTPTPYADGGTGRGNYATLNPLLASASLSAGNLDFTQANTKTAATFGVTSGKWYSEAKLNTTANGYVIVGVAKVGDGSSYNMFASGVGYYANDGTKYVDGTNTSYGATYTAGDTIAIALDMDGGTVTFYKNNTSQGSITLPASSQGYFPYAIQASSGSTSATWSANFGQRPFTYTPPTGFKALNTQNLPVTTITNGATVFAATTYTGTGSSYSVTNGGNPLGTTFKPDFVWVKERSQIQDHALFDSVRGATKQLSSNTTGAEATYANSLSAFNSNGFTVVSDAVVNSSSQTYVAWQWQAGQGTTSSNTSGSITSTVSVNTTAGFSIVTYTGTGANATVGHGLGVAPKMIIVKNRGPLTWDWIVYHGSLGATQYMILDTTAAAASSALAWNNTEPTSSVFSLGTGASVNRSGDSHVAYCWAAVAGYSAFGSYTGNGSTDGPFIFTGFRPRWLMVKRTDTTAFNWVLFDTARSTTNVASAELYPNLSIAEGTDSSFDFLSNGFKLRVTSGNKNASGGTYIYAAFAENPLKFSLAR